ncbi:MAG TPA: SDR family oxidoreductase [Myxococcota bacterium]|nr:SDR family oxidoreductase [Myxococcota bacterium]
MSDARIPALLDGRVALVTGAARGIGRAIARCFASAGADLALCDRDAEGLAEAAREAEAQGRRALTAVLDVREETAVAGFFDAVAAAFPRLDVLVNNAGGGFHAAFADVSAKGQDALVRENFGQVADFVRRALPSLREGGSIINVTSIEAHRAAPGYAIYSAMKAAVANLTKTLALELGPRGIRVNCIAPDAIPTPGVGDALPPTPLARRGHADDVANAALYLASPLAAFVTGTTLHVDGGNHAAGGWRRRADGTWES